MSDSLLSDSETKEIISERKIRKIKGELYGLVGVWKVFPLVWKWIEKGGKVPQPAPEGFGWEMVKVDNKGKVWQIGSDSFDWQRVTPPTYIGTGGAYAKAALLAGASPKEAVRIASEIDLHSGGGVVEIKL